jgi:hypothetical protein
LRIVLWLTRRYLDWRRAAALGGSLVGHRTAMDRAQVVRVRLKLMASIFAAR